ncbi:hypothetical protein ABQG68_19915, partial [Bacillus pumilus]|uniref:hypothetical protein n=1 Tax=Bacillus pumilus TaxID=1408 RepID=UPI003347E66E
RQNIIDGLTRSQFISVKLVIAFLLALITTIVVVINATVFGLLFGSTFKFEGFIYIPYAFIQSFTYILFALFLAFIMRKSGLALAVFFLYGLIFENLLMGLIGNYISEKGKYFLPLQTGDTLVPMPFGKTVIYRQAPEDLTLIIA